MEIWKSVVGYEGIYEVSDLGRVRTYQRAKSLGCLFRAGRIHKQVKRAGYFQVHLRGPKSCQKSVHVLMLEAFVCPRPPKCVARHLDCDSGNNVLKNLAWGTPKENRADSIRIGRHTKGSRNNTSKLGDVQVLAIRALARSGFKKASLARQFGVTAVNIGYIVKRKVWQHI